MRQASGDEEFSLDPLAQPRSDFLWIAKLWRPAWACPEVIP